MDAEKRRKKAAYQNQYYHAHRTKISEQRKKLHKPGESTDRVRAHRQKHGRGKDNPMKARAWQLKKNYGITPEQYDTMLKAQSGTCAICRAAPKKISRNSMSLHVDHDHATGKIRGLLCHDCNPALGKFKDSPELLEAAAAYLRTHGRA